MMRDAHRSGSSARSSLPVPIAALLGAALSLMAGGVAAAPHGAGVNVCDEAGLSGSLRGLCTAYCEALDCDADEPRGSATACAALERNYMRESDGEPLPCQAPDCPCFTADEVEVLARTLDHPSTYENLRCIDRRPGKPITALAAQRIDGEPCSPESNDCSALAIEFTEDNACELNTPSESRQVQEISEGQREACRANVIAGAGAAGLDCN